MNTTGISVFNIYPIEPQHDQNGALELLGMQVDQMIGKMHSLHGIRHKF